MHITESKRTRTKGSLRATSRSGSKKNPLPCSRLAPARAKITRTMAPPCWVRTSDPGVHPRARSALDPARARTLNPEFQSRVRARPWILRARADLRPGRQAARARSASYPEFQPRVRARSWILRARADLRPGRQAARARLALDPARARGPPTRACTRACALGLGPCARADPRPGIPAARARSVADRKKESFIHPHVHL